MRLTKITKAPKYLRQNFVLSGYRDVQQTSWPLLACLGSLLTLHNQTINIWTHLLGAVFFLSRCLRAEGDLSITLFRFSSVACLGLSASYHTFAPISKEMNKLLLRMDYLGIVIQVRTCVCVAGGRVSASVRRCRTVASRGFCSHPPDDPNSIHFPVRFAGVLFQVFI